MFDAHCHLGWFQDPAQVACEVATRGMSAFAVTVTPDEFLRRESALAGLDNVMLAVGLHPWWVRDATDADALVEALPSRRWVGEIGLDASSRRVATWDAQLAVFERACRVCARTSDPSAPKVLSIHAVRAAGIVLDILEQTRAAARCRCVMHWFSGTSEELARAVRLGCWFSFGERALATRRGRAYARSLPAESLLTETDLPASPGAPDDADYLVASVARAEVGVAAARGLDTGGLQALLARNAAALLA